MNKSSENPEFMKTIEDIRGAEKEYDRVISQAKEKADRILRNAKETVHEEREKTEEDIVALKDERIRGGSKEIESKVDSMVKKAKAEASQVSKKKVDSKAVTRLVKDFISSL